MTEHDPVGKALDLATRSGLNDSVVEEVAERTGSSPWLVALMFALVAIVTVYGCANIKQQRTRTVQSDNFTYEVQHQPSGWFFDK